MDVTLSLPFVNKVKSLQIFEDVTEEFGRLIKKSILVRKADMELREALVVVLYEGTQQHWTSLNLGLICLFSNSIRQYGTISPTRAALHENTKRAAYQDGYLWGVSVTHEHCLTCPGDWGWINETADGLWITNWPQ